MLENVEYFSLLSTDGAISRDQKTALHAALIFDGFHIPTGMPPIYRAKLSIDHFKTCMKFDQNEYNRNSH